MVISRTAPCPSSEFTRGDIENGGWDHPRDLCGSKGTLYLM